MTPSDHAARAPSEAQKLVEGLFTNGSGEEADRLVLWRDIAHEDRHALCNLGGWSRKPVLDRVQKFAQVAQQMALEDVRDAADKFNAIVDTVEARCMAADGPVTPTLKEMTEKELRALWKQVQRLREIVRGAP